MIFNLKAFIISYITISDTQVTKGKPSLLKSGAPLHNLSWSNFLLFRIQHERGGVFSRIRSGSVDRPLLGRM